MVIPGGYSRDMALVIDNAALLSIEWYPSDDDHPPVNVLGLHGPAGIVVSQAMADDIAALIGDVWTSSELDDAMGNHAPNIVTVTDLQTETGPKVSAPTGIFGLGATMSPSQVALVTRFTTALRGKSYTGRVYLPSPTEDMTAGSFANGALVDAATAFWQGLNDGLSDTSGGAASLGVISRKLELITPVTGISTNSRLDTQRRRNQ